MDGSQKGKREVFGFDMCLDDIKVIVFKEPVTLGAWTDPEIDWQIQALKNDLDTLAADMKKAALKHF